MMNTDKENMIQKIEEELQSYSDIEQSYYGNEWNCVNVYSGLAKTLYDRDFRIIGKDDIVISKEDYNELLELTRTNTIDRVLNWLWTSKDIKQEILNLAKQHNIELEEKR